MKHTEVQVLAERLRRTERRLLAVCVVGLLSVFTLGVLAVSRPAAAQPEVVRARAVELVDASGQTRLVLNVSADGTSRIQFIDTAGKVRIGMGLALDMAPILSLNDRQGRVRAHVNVSRDGTPGIRLTNAAGRTVWRAP